MVTTEEDFSIASFSQYISGDFLVCGISRFLPKVLAFRWLAILGGILTMDNLRKCKIVTVNGCPICLVDEEPVNHPSLNCHLAGPFKSSFFNDSIALGLLLLQYQIFF